MLHDALSLLLFTREDIASFVMKISTAESFVIISLTGHKIIEPRREKIGLRGFRPGLTV